MGHRLVQYLNSKHVCRLISEPYHPEHNGRAKRAYRTIVELMQATLLATQIQKKFGHEILKSCCLALNQIPRKNQEESPWSILHGRQFPENFLKLIGTKSVILQMPKNGKSWKFNSKGEEGTLVGFNVPLLSYRVLRTSGKIIESKHVRFLKRDSQPINIEMDVPMEGNLKETSNANPPEPIELQESKSSNHGENDHINPDLEDSSDSDGNTQIENQLTQTDTPTPAPTTRTLRDQTLIKPPSAIQCFDNKYWKEAIEKEVNSIEHHEVRHSLNDTLGAFLHAPLTEDVYIKTPKGSPKNWYETLTNWLNSLGFIESSSDPCLYICDDKISMVFFNVNDPS
ncbi:uncharacterized protein VP01_5782g1 [Puccinia sorghi]|uniref:Integrase catalytic domain-containing protein n=1 Tax=Puccinia sorghi TaxID=27349 RepID=A0A0L6UID2_9BASI|nr:uncharacterized protein VP01_5782g1 [Puccinia sorghi]